MDTWGRVLAQVPIVLGVFDSLGCSHAVSLCNPAWHGILLPQSLLRLGSLLSTCPRGHSSTVCRNGCSHVFLLLGSAK